MAALKLICKLLKKQGWPPTRIVTDKLTSYHVVSELVDANFPRGYWLSYYRYVLQTDQLF